MLAEILLVLMILAWAGSKYVLAIGLILYYDYNFGEAMLLAVLGGMMGVVFFSYTRDMLKLLWYKYFPRRQPRRRFTPYNRFLVRVKQRFGLAGIAFLTPVVLTVPVGAFIASSMYKNKPVVFAYMFAAFVFWSLLFVGTYHILDVDITKVLH